MSDPIWKKTCKAIVRIFETGSPHGNPSAVTVHPDDPGGLTYGTAQTTLMSGNLHKLISDYCETPHAQHADAMAPYLSRFRRKDRSLNDDLSLHDILRQAGRDPVMQSVQEEFFDERFWKPAARKARSLEIESALGHAVIYDSQVHGSLRAMIRKTRDAIGSVQDRGEHAWLQGYVETRRNWLATHRIRLLRTTIYRMDTFQELMAQGIWNLDLPLVIRSIMLDEAMLENPPTDPVPSVITLRRGMKGERIRQLQRALASLGEAIRVDGDFGPRTEMAVTRFQQAHGLVADGVVGPATYAAYREYIQSGDGNL